MGVQETGYASYQSLIMGTTEEMNSKERLCETIRRRPTDRVPVHFRAEPETLEKIYQRIGIRDYDRLLDYLDSDIRCVDAVYPPIKKCGEYYENCWGERHIFRPSQFGPVREMIDGALTDVQSLDDFKKYPWPKIDDLDYSGVAAFCDRFSDRGIAYGWADFSQRPSNARGMQNFLMDMSLHPEYVHYMTNYFTEFYVEDFRRAQRASGNRIDMFFSSTDLGTQSGPMISSKAFREFIKPYLKRLADAAHEVGAALFYHTCGMIEPFIEEIIEVGVDILDPIQPCNPKMQPEILQERFGGRICFHGGIDVQGILATGTPEQVQQEVLRYENAFKHQGYIVSSSHYLQMDTSVENMFAIFNKSVDGIMQDNSKVKKSILL